MKRYLYNASVEGAGGSQTFYVDAETREEADAKLKANGPTDIYAADVDVTDLGKFEFDSETSVDDFGDFPPEPTSLVDDCARAAAKIHRVDVICHMAAEIYRAKDEDAAQAIINRMRALLEGAA